MTILYHNNRQYPKFATAILRGDAKEGSKILLPPGSVLLGDGGLVVTAALAGTAPTLTVADDSVTPVTFLDAAALGTAGHTPLEDGLAGKYYPAGAELTISYGGTPTPDSGEAIFYFGYLVKDAENELYGRSA